MSVKLPAQVAPHSAPDDAPGRVDAPARAVRWGQGWGPLLLAPAAVAVLVPATWPRWAFMWALASAVYAGCKWLTWRRTPVRGVSPWKQAGYLLAWPGLGAASFLDPHPARRPVRPTRAEWRFAAGKAALGVGFVFAVVRRVAPHSLHLAGWVGMAGIVLALHFGAFHLLSCAWRRVGVEARPLMDWPVASVSVHEFWGRRWNTAFRDLTHRFLFRPLASRLGPRWAVGVGFLFSGLVHELVISVPAGGGYGGPTLFFALQGAAVLVERSAPGRRAGLGRGLRGRLFTMLVLLAPVGALFHPPFVEEVVLPFLRALGAV